MWAKELSASGVEVQFYDKINCYRRNKFVFKGDTPCLIGPRPKTSSRCWRENHFCQFFSPPEQSRRQPILLRIMQLWVVESGEEATERPYP